MKKKWKNPLYHKLLPGAGLFLIKLLSRTIRVAFMDPENETTGMQRGSSLIYASWHQRFFPGITLFAKRKPIAIMVSQSRDGEFIAAIISMLGWEPVRGSSSRGGRSALLNLKKRVHKGYKIGHIVDGPRGPFGRVKPGLVAMAQVTGAAIVPTICSAEKYWQAQSWDRFMIPRPFSRVVIRFGEPFFVPADLSENEFEDIRLAIEGRMRTLYEETDRLWQNPEAARSVFSSRQGSGTPCFSGKKSPSDRFSPKSSDKA